MAMFYEGYGEARGLVREMNHEQLLKHLDALYGRDDLPDDFTDEDLLNEALEQTKREFTDTSSEDYQRAEFWIGVYKASARNL